MREPAGHSAHRRVRRVNRIICDRTLARFGPRDPPTVLRCRRHDGVDCIGRAVAWYAVCLW